jgi:formylglycine-generating enzyme required for sulfatase activity
MLVHAVTNRQFRQLVPDHTGDDDLPAVDVDWYRAYAYAAWLGGRLPTEAEWEYAARAGCPHPYCDRQGNATTLDKVGWYSDNSGGKLHPVMQLEPNPWGLYDLYGNAWEWVADWYAKYPDGSQVDPWGPPSGVNRVIRGGGFWDVALRARAAHRYGWDPEIEFVDLGFRVVLPAAPSD